MLCKSLTRSRSFWMSVIDLLKLSVQVPSNPGKTLGGGPVILFFSQRLSVFFFCTHPIALYLVHTTKVHVRVAVAFIPRSLKRPLEPWNGFFDLTFRQ